jgi:hypothetical protein
VVSVGDEPAVGATIAVSTLTDDSGRYRLLDVPKGSYYVAAGLVELPTYYPGVRGTTDAIAVSVDAGATVTRDFAMVVPNGFVVKGRVVNRTNQPPPDKLRAFLSAPGKFVSIAVAPDGSFEFHKVLPGTYILYVNPESGATGPRQSTGLRIVDRDVTGVEWILRSD